MYYKKSFFFCITVVLGGILIKWNIVTMQPEHIPAIAIKENSANAQVRHELARHFSWQNMNDRAIAKIKKISIDKITESDREDYSIGQLGPLKMYPTPEDYLQVKLGNATFTVTGKLGSGDEAVIYKIIGQDGRQYALKLYEDEFSTAYQQGDLLAMTKTHKSRKFLNVPIEVNIEYGYSIFPLLDFPYYAKPNPEKFREFERKLDEALTQDGLVISDSDNKQNYMYDSMGHLWRIDLSTLEEFRK